MTRSAKKAFVCRLLTAVFFLTVVFSRSGYAEQLKFGDWVGIEGPDPLTKKIGTFAKDGVSTLWISDPGSDTGTVRLILESKKAMASDYFSYQIDNIETLTIRSAQKGCDSNCLTDDVPRQGEFIKAIKRGLHIRFEYDSDPNITHTPIFSLRGFTKAYRWLLGE